MNPIAQKDEFGCGVAAFAYVAGLTYEQAIKSFKKQNAQTTGFFCRDIVNAFKKIGRDFSYKYIKPKLRKNIYESGAIVFISRSKKYPVGHYLARAHGAWMDPWINFPHDQNIKNAHCGLRKRLPGRAIYAIFPTWKD